VALPNGELEVARLEKSALTCGQAILVDTGKDLLGRACDDASLRQQARGSNKADEESESDEESAYGPPICGRRMIVFVGRGRERIQSMGLSQARETAIFLSTVRFEP
jgi:hypothetical protein